MVNNVQALQQYKKALNSKVQQILGHLDKQYRKQYIDKFGLFSDTKGLLKTHGGDLELAKKAHLKGLQQLLLSGLQKTYNFPIQDLKNAGVSRIRFKPKDKLQGDIEPYTINKNTLYLPTKDSQYQDLMESRQRKIKHSISGQYHHRQQQINKIKHILDSNGIDHPTDQNYHATLISHIKNSLAPDLRRTVKKITIIKPSQSRTQGNHYIDKDGTLYVHKDDILNTKQKNAPSAGGSAEQSIPTLKGPSAQQADQ